MKEKKEEERRKKGVENCTRSVEGAGVRTGTGLIIATMALALALCVVFAQSASAVQVSVIPAYQEVRTGENFTVSIYIDPEGSEVYGAQYYLYFANTLLNATAQAKGPFLGDNTMEIVNEINNTFNSTHGITKYGETILGGSAVTQPGILANISFEAIAEENGISELWFDKVKLYNPDGYKIENVTVNHGNVSVRVGICGDVNDDEEIDMADVMTLWYDFADYPYPGAYTISNEWAADVNCDHVIDMADVMTLWYDFADYPYPDVYVVSCC